MSTASPTRPSFARARTSGAIDETRPTSKQASRKLGSRSFNNERAPPLWLVRSERKNKDDDDDACSSADSVRSDYREPDGSEHATTHSPASHAVSSSSEYLSATEHDARKVHRMSGGKKDKERELPAVPGAESRRPASGSSSRDPVRSPQSASASPAGIQAKDQLDLTALNASTAGEWVNKLQALRDVAEEHSSCARRIFAIVEDMFPEARDFPSSTKAKIMEDIFVQLELSRQLLERHAQGLIGTDLAELRMMKAEQKRLDDKITRMNKLFAKEMSTLRDLLQKKKETAGPIAPPKSAYEPLMFMEPAQRGCLLALLEEKLEALLKANPEMQRRVNQPELSRLQDLFKKEQQSSLERQVAKLAEEEQGARKQIAVLEAYNEKLQQKIRKVDESLSRSATLVLGDQIEDGEDYAGNAIGVKEASSTALTPPAGKPKSGRPKRGATFTRAGSSDVGEVQAASPSDSPFRMPGGS